MIEGYLQLLVSFDRDQYWVVHKVHLILTETAIHYIKHSGGIIIIPIPGICVSNRCYLLISE